MIRSPLLNLLELMKKFDARLLLTLAEEAGVYTGIGLMTTDNPEIRETNTQLSLQQLARLQEQCAELGLIATAATCRRLVSAQQQPKNTLNEMRDLWRELQGRLRDELEARVLLFIESDKAHLFTNQNLFGQQVADRFPSSASDIEEAGKCLALGRNTACVFHLMRVLESGLHALGASLNDPNLNPNINPTWERILSRGDTELMKAAQNRSPEWQAKPDFFRDAIASLRAVKTAWRNPTMHVQSAYDEERALDIFYAVRGLMRHLATELHE